MPIQFQHTVLPSQAAHTYEENIVLFQNSTVDFLLRRQKNIVTLNLQRCSSCDPGPYQLFKKLLSFYLTLKSYRVNTAKPHGGTQPEWLLKVSPDWSAVQKKH